MDTEFIHPNLHVTLIHLPLALLLVGTLIELFAFMWRRHGFRAAGRWMILIGALSCVPSVLTGLYAYKDVATHGELLEKTWNQTVATSSLNEHAWDMLGDHLTLMIVATALALLVVVTWMGCSDRWRARLHLPLLAVLLGSVGTALAGAWHGGEAVYRHGVAIGAAEATVASSSAPATREASESDEMDSSRMYDPAYYLPPIQLHLILAGCVVAIEFAALGLSIRKITQGPPVTQVDYIAAALGPPPTLLGDEAPDTLVSDPQDLAVPRVPASRFWMLGMLLAILTAAGGYWIIAKESGTWAFDAFWQDTREHLRMFAHLIAGSSIIVLSVVMAMLARFAPRRSWLLTIFTILLVACIAAQVWFGVLLLFDTDQGTLTGFNG